MKSWYSISNKSDTLAEISIYEEIGLWGVTAKQFITDLKAVGDRKLKLRINSPGGDVFQGLAIYNRLREHKAGVEVVIDGIAASMASVIAMAGTTVSIAENALIMIHNPSTIAAGDAADMRDAAELLDKVRDSIVTAYERKTQLGTAKLVAMLDAETWLSAAEAKTLGFVDTVTDPLKVAANFDMRRFRNPPANNKPSMKLLNAALAAILATASKQPITEDSTEAEIKAAIDKVTADLTAKETAVTNLTTERDQLKQQFTAATEEATTAKNDLVTAKATITTLTTEKTDLSAKLNASNENVTRLEKLCKLKGVNPKDAVTNDDPETDGGDERQQLLAALSAATTPEARGKAAKALRDFDLKAKK